MKSVVPCFAVVGHPNEGKSSVLSTLAEDDSVRVSPVPGETIECRDFPVVIDGREIIRFIDTPGFQNPRNTLRWMQHYQGAAEDLVQEFIRAHEQDPVYRDDCELMSPLLRGAGIIFVVDASRPLRNVDRAEMEILRLTGRPRMAIINSKGDDTAYLAQWRNEFRKNFNSIRIFNSNRATYAERIELLESLKAIDQELQGVLEMVISAFRKDWAARNQMTADAIVTMLIKILSHRMIQPCPEDSDEKAIREDLYKKFLSSVHREEQKTHQQIRSYFKHNIFTYDLPVHSILQEDLFSQRTWKILGLSRSQLVMAGALGGAAIGAGVDVAAAGITFGVFSAAGGAIGAAGAALKGKGYLSGARLLGMKLDHQDLQIGPVKNIQLLYILLDRAQIFYSQIINWAHGRRDYAEGQSTHDERAMNLVYTKDWDRSARQTCESFFKALQQDTELEQEKTTAALKKLLATCLDSVSRDQIKDKAAP
ncbi:MAG: GTPase/DUF3482 domain-containing protein [Proteobacteria bacterium]|nr:GTPase/DUF3482 domain-containing protein [Pseudomonadota bacterium]MBU1687566.1 GTPase/DUF3482 domain-containing protein [Pseudomonadota bacterium]